MGYVYGLKNILIQLEVAKMTESEKIEEELMNIMLRNVEEQSKRGNFHYLSEKFKQDIDELIIRGAKEQRTICRVLKDRAETRKINQKEINKIFAEEITKTPKTLYELHYEASVNATQNIFK